VFESILKRAKTLYKECPMVVFLEDTEIPKIMEAGKREQWEMFRAKDVSEIVTKS